MVNGKEEEIVMATHKVESGRGSLRTGDRVRAQGSNPELGGVGSNFLV